MRTRLRTFVTAVVLSTGIFLAAAGCGSSPADPGADAPAASSEPTPGAQTAPPATEAATATTVIARLAGSTDVHENPSPSSPVATTLDATTELGSTTVLVVLDERDGWLHVSLPVRPNGSTGWIAAESVERRETQLRVEVDLDARTLRLFDGDELMEESTVAVGAPDTPTPRGIFFVTDLVDTGDEDGAYGPYALGLSGHSDELTEFAGGDGQVGIHGTNDPSSIGQDVSHGCVRLPNDVIARLVELVPLGTPVHIV